jgi:hypothetical protein
VLYVAEVKSLTLKNEEKQLRRGLGQVLLYWHVLGQAANVVPVLAAEREPTDASWPDLCDVVGGQARLAGRVRRIALLGVSIARCQASASGEEAVGGGRHHTPFDSSASRSGWNQAISSSIEPKLVGTGLFSMKKA